MVRGCEKPRAHLGAAEVEDLDVVLGILERKAGAAQDAQRGAERVARHEDLGVLLELFLELEHLIDLRVGGRRGEGEMLVSTWLG